MSAARSLGYQLTVTQAAVSPDRVSIRVANRGTAPFYYDWPVELAAVDHRGHVVRHWRTPWTVAGIQPGPDPAEMSTRISTRGLRDGRYDIVLRVPNPMRGGIPLRFANTTQDARTGWLKLGSITQR